MIKSSTCRNSCFKSSTRSRKLNDPLENHQMWHHQKRKDVKLSLGKIRKKIRQNPCLQRGASDVIYPNQKAKERREWLKERRRQKQIWLRRLTNSHLGSVVYFLIGLRLTSLVFLSYTTRSSFACRSRTNWNRLFICHVGSKWLCGLPHAFLFIYVFYLMTSYRTMFSLVNHHTLPNHFFLFFKLVLFV